MATPDPVPTSPPIASPAPITNPAVAAFISSNLPSSTYNATGAALTSAALGSQVANASTTVSVFSSANGSFPTAPAGTISFAVAANPAANTTIALPSGGYGGLIATGTNPAILTDAAGSSAVLVGNAGATTFNSTGASSRLVGGNGNNRFNVSGSTAVISTGDGQNTVVATNSAGMTVFTGTGTNTVVLAGGSNVQSNGTDTVFGGSGNASIFTAKGVTVVGGDGLLTIQGGSTSSFVFGGNGGVNYAAGSGNAYDVVISTGTLNAQLGAGGGQLWGNGTGGNVLRGGTGQSVLYGAAGSKLYSFGSAGNYLVAGSGGDVSLDGSNSIGNDVFFGGSQGGFQFICGTGNDLIGTGTGLSTVQVGSGNSTVFAFGDCKVVGDTGSASVVIGSTAFSLDINPGNARTFALFNFVPGADKINAAGYGSTAISNALATQVNGGGQTVLTFSDNTRLQLVGVARADNSFF